MDINYYKKYEPIFGEWKIVREIGAGSFGRVFEIERKNFGRTYKAALKIITVPQSEGELQDAMMEFDDDSESVTAYFRGFIEEMADEFDLMSQLKGNSNIVSYEDHSIIAHEGGIGWDILIRMELLTPIISHIKMSPLSREDIIKLGTDICRALEHCQKLNIIHRDIKPENIFISRFGDYKLGDFGVARTSERTMGGLSRKGTYTYMAPEVYKSEAYGASVDIYSLGLVLYRFLNGNRAPFLPPPPSLIKSSERETALIRRIRGEALPAPCNADEALAEVILRACAYKPEDRYKSPTEMREALEAVATVGADAPAVKDAPDTVDAEAGETTVGIFSQSSAAPANGDTEANKVNPPEEREAVPPPRAEEKLYETDDEKTVGIFKGVPKAVSDAHSQQTDTAEEAPAEGISESTPPVAEFSSESAVPPEAVSEAESAVIAVEPAAEQTEENGNETNSSEKKPRSKKKRRLILSLTAAALALALVVILQPGVAVRSEALTSATGRLTCMKYYNVYGNTVKVEYYNTDGEVYQVSHYNSNGVFDHFTYP